jgi:hypothetical protein
MNLIDALMVEAPISRGRAAESVNSSVFRFGQMHVRVLHSGGDIWPFLCHPGSILV